MRIIGGEARGRKIFVTNKCQIRPTSNKIKESLFSIIHPVVGKSFLDVFAGCGNVGLEALSRGASFAVFIENDLLMAEAIIFNVEVLGYKDKTEILNTTAEKGIVELSKRRKKFDFIFADPPYEQGLLFNTLKHLENANLTESEGIVVFQHSVREDIQEYNLKGYLLSDRRKYGDTILSFFKINLEE